MRLGEFQTATRRIQDAWDDLLTAWNELRDHWDDSQADMFEDNYLKTIGTEVSRSIPIAGQMSQAVGAAHRDCSE